MSKLACRYAQSCSGCTGLQKPYSKQLRDKYLRVRQAFAGIVRAQELDATIKEVKPSPVTRGYRSSTKLCLDEDNFGKKRIGLYQHQSKTVIDIPECPVHFQAINQLITKNFRATDNATSIPFYQHSKRSFQAGRLKFLTVRLDPVTGAAGVIISHTGIDRGILEKWAQGTINKNISLFESTIIKADESRVISDRVSHLTGPERVNFTIGRQVFSLSPLAFFQANYSLTEAFVDHITASLSGDILLDLYGGFGAYSYACAKHVRRVYLVDGNSSAIEAASAQTLVPKSLRPVCSSVEDFLSRHSGLAIDRKSVEHIIINPPRGGLSAKVAGFLADRTKLPNAAGITYVSCNPMTLTRDLRTIMRTGHWQILDVTPFDMFPQTEHIEVVVKLALK